MQIWLCLIFFLFSQIFAEEITRNYDISYIEVFSYEGSGRIEIQQGEKNSFVIKGEKQVIENTLVKVERGVLSVGPINLASRITDVIEGKLTVKNLRKILLNGNVAVDIDHLKGENLMIMMGDKGSSLIEGIIDFKQLAVSISGRCKALLKGNVKTAMIHVKGDGNFEGEELVTDEVKVWMDRSGIVNVKESVSEKKPFSKAVP